MKNQKVADHYNKLYSDDEKAFSEPVPFVRVLPKFLTSGMVLEIGAAAGGNALFLAAQGFDVRAIDISSAAIERLLTQARDRDLKVQAAVADIAEEDLQEDYDAIICTFVFHHLSKDDALSVIQRIQRHTKPGGYNLITAFTKRGDFFRGSSDNPNFYLDDKGHLERHYAGWKAADSFEKEARAASLSPQGKPQVNVFAGLLAQKQAG